MTSSSSLRLASVNPSPAIRRVRKPTPLISSEARKREAQGKPFYERAHLKPSDLPSTYLALTSYRPRVERRSWRGPAAVVVGVVIGLGVLGAFGNVTIACGFGALAALGTWLMDGWSR